MGGKNLETGWQETSQKTLMTISRWRKEHPKATWAEIEKAVDEDLGRLRRQVLEDVAQASEAADWTSESDEGPLCSKCGARLEAGSREKRKLTTGYEQIIELERRYGLCPKCETGLFPPG